MKKLILTIIFVFLFLPDANAFILDFTLSENSSIEIMQEPYPLSLSGTFSIEFDSYSDSNPVFNIINSDIQTSSSSIDLEMQGKLYLGPNQEIYRDNLVAIINQFQTLPEYSIDSSFSTYEGLALNPLSLSIKGTNGMKNWYIYAERSDVGSDAVPEPATLLLFGTGLVGFAIRRRRT